MSSSSSNACCNQDTAGLNEEGLREGSGQNKGTARAETQDPATASHLEQIREYYGHTLQSSNDLQTNACCCSSDSMPPYVRSVLPLIADEILDRFYGCGSPLPPLLDGLTVLDLGCGTGRDCYLAAKLVGEQGLSIGVDMTSEQIAVARSFEAEQAARFGYRSPNTRFLQGYIEDLAGLDIEDDSVDVVISNCVINLSPDKERVFAEIYRVLKPGGELYFSDIFADRRLPVSVQTDPLLRGECLGGALYVEDFRRLLAQVGFADFRYTAHSAVTVDNPELAEKVGGIGFSSRTVRAFKLPSLEDRCEDYGQVAWYLGSIPGFPHSFALDDHHRLSTGKPMLVCGNTAALLSETRFAPHFRVEGNRSVHFGLFACGGGGSAGTVIGSAESCACASSDSATSSSGSASCC
jgi:SAM-dependent methyltransferase